MKVCGEVKSRLKPESQRLSCNLLKRKNFQSTPGQSYLQNTTENRRITNVITQKMKFSIKDFFSKCDQIRRKLRILSHLLKKSLMKNFIFCATYLRWSALQQQSTPKSLSLTIDSLQIKNLWSMIHISLLNIIYDKTWGLHTNFTQMNSFAYTQFWK